jgi:hypothetical protein
VINITTGVGFFCDVATWRNDPQDPSHRDQSGSIIIGDEVEAKTACKSALKDAEAQLADAQAQLFDAQMQRATAQPELVCTEGRQ